MAASEDFDFCHDDQDRSVPVRLWTPDNTPCRAWVLFSVGFGGERSGYAYLARAWATLGIATAVVEHIGSNLDVLKSLPGKTRQERNLAVAQRVGDPAELAARPTDLLLVHRRLASRFDLLPLGLAGHSYGTYTVLAAQGLPTVPKLPALAGALTGVHSSLVISPQPPGTLFSPRALAEVRVPTLVVTGTKDALLNGDADYLARVAVYHHLPAELRNLAVLRDVEHMAFAGLGLKLGATLRAMEGLTGRWWESTLLSLRAEPQSRAAAMAEAASQAGVLGEYR